ncbi:glycerophosphoryl diester phosphodiesterase membrane domain-containing protein [Arthrobacter sp. JZ12]|uniref:glycerophosphoryl diester phosphodiesterase membrane domain-containing protein n=1 Tax=Arthrobacter sp. JZ12 TaxID=2654190 RepID=UPI002B494003|nr:hypothetical protein [Arthrobacter sp. JZ12]
MPPAQAGIGWPSTGPVPYGYQAPPKPGIIPLRPLGLGEILDGAFQACRRNPLSTFGIAILFQVVIAVITVLLTFGLTGTLANLDPVTASASQVTGLVASALSVGSVLVLLTSAGVLILQGVLIIPIARAVLNERTGFAQLWKLAWGRILPLIGLGLILVLLWTVSVVVLVLIFVGLSLAFEEAAIAIVIVGILLAIVAAVWLNIKWVMAPAALMLEGVGPITALRRSWTLTTRNWWRTFGILVLTAIIVSIITQVVTAPLSFIVFGFGSFTTDPASAETALLESLPVLLITQAVTAVFTAIGFAFQAGVTALLYVDLRIRREGFDIVLLRENEARTQGRATSIPGRSAGGTFGHPGDRGPSNQPGT